MNSLSNKFAFLILIFLAGMQSAFAANFKASASPNRLEVGQQLQITFEVNSTNVSGFKAPVFRNFSVLAGPSQSSYTQIMNNRVSQSYSYSYVLKAEKEGTFTIPPADIKVDGNLIHSNSVQITVTKADPNRVAAEKKKKDAQDKANKDLDKQAKEIIAKNLFMRLSVNKNSAYKGEPVYASYKLYVHPELNLLNIAAPKMPVYNGFWSQEIDISQIAFTSTETINGTRYKVADLKKVLLIPQQTGDLVVEPLEMEFTVRLRTQNNSRRRGSFFDDFFDDPFASNYKDFKYNGKSATAKVHVKPLPEPLPAEFGNAVGDYKFTTTIDKTRLKTNEPVSLRMKISGNGNLKLVQAPLINLPTDFEQFEPKINDKISMSAAGMSGEKDFEYIIIPRSAGKFTIPGAKFVYFDYTKGKYITLTSDDIQIEVEKGLYANYGTNSQDVALLNSDIRFIKPESDFWQIGSHTLTSPYFIFAILIPLGAFIFLILYKRRKEDRRDNIGVYNAKNAAKYAKKRFAYARKELENGNPDAFYTEAHKAMLEYLGYKFEMPVAELTKENILRLMSEKAGDDSTSTAELATDYIAKCEFARYAPSGAIGSPQELLAEGENIIINFEQLLAKGRKA